MQQVEILSRVLFLALVEQDSQILNGLIGQWNNMHGNLLRLLEQAGSQCPASRRSTFTFVKRQISKTIALLEIWQATSEASRELEVAWARKSYYYPVENTSKLKSVRWEFLCGNHITQISLENLNKAVKQKLDVRLSLQRAPRGSVAIVELWRQDVGSVIESILQASCDQPWQLPCLSLTFNLIPAQVNDTHETRDEDVSLNITSHYGSI